ncbi:hypothetical protein [Microterricola viridarii]|uniref:TadE family protein n=1 Tax=Microterricola viridarii TaxID=412690 RepID=A0A1H1S2S8_9MICO|nr:hypothetical protein [Microterricola viridarii]SDS42183.1 hypothetical protein SAMN04489834_1451 [Microterricola viridarii]
MRPWSFRTERGSASLEFLTVGLILMVPLVYLVLAVSALQAGALAAEGAARQAARAFVQAANEEAGQAAAGRALAVTLADYGLPTETSTLEFDCGDGQPRCLVRGEVVTVSVRVTVALPLVPDVLGLQQSASVPLAASATQRVSTFWGAAP